MKFLLVCLSVAAASLCTTPHAHAAPIAGAAKQDAKTGTFAGLKWKSLQGGAAWDFSAQRVRATLPAGGNATLQAEADATLPAGDWTMDAWLVHRTDFAPPDVLLSVGDASKPSGELEIKVEGDGRTMTTWRSTPAPKPVPPGTVVITGSGADRFAGQPTSTWLATGGGSVADLPVRWVRVVHRRAQNRFDVFINGKPLIPDEIDKRAAPLDFKALAGPLHLAVTASGRDKPIAVDLAALEIRPSISEPVLSLPGLAYVGWSAKAAASTTLSPEVAARVRKQLETLLATPGQDDRGAASALAGLMLLNSSGQGIAPALWEQVSRWVVAHAATSYDAWAALPTEGRDLVGPRHAALSLVLCVAAGSGNAAQKQQCREWARPLARVWSYVRSNVGDDVSLADAYHALLDPAAFADNSPPQAEIALWLTRDLATQLRGPAPDMALSILCRALGEADNRESLAWLLPELRQVSPRYAALSTDYVSTLGRGEGSSGALSASVPEGWLSKAAFRTAAYDIEQGLALWQQIKKPALRAETITAIADQVLDPPVSSHGSPAKPVDKALGSRLDALVEGAMKAEIAAWKPSKRNDSDVPERVRLALWRAKRGRTAPALEDLKSAEGRIGKLPATIFRDTWAIARAYRDLKAPQAAAWLDKSIAAAITRDKDAEEPDGAAFYLAASTIVARELVRLQRLDEALALAKRLEDSGLDRNASLVTSSVVGALGRSGSPENLERLRKMLPGLQGAPRTIALSALAEDLARTDLAGAFKMLGELDQEARIRTTLRLASKAPDLNAPLVRDVVQQAVAEHLKAWHTARNYSTQEIVLDLLDQLSAAQMASLAPAFAGEPSEFAWQMLQTIARDKGLSNDPLWQRMRGVKPSGSIPWAPTMLADAQRSEDEQPRLLPAPPLPSQP